MRGQFFNSPKGQFLDSLDKMNMVTAAPSVSFWPSLMIWARIVACRPPHPGFHSRSQPVESYRVMRIEA